MRKIYSLNKGWKFGRRDPKIPETMHPDYFDNFPYDTKTCLFKGANATNFYDGKWQTVDLPHDWAVYDLPDGEKGVPFQGYRPQGEAWYRKSFVPPAGLEGKRVYLKFDAIAISSDVYFNNQHMAHGDSSYVPLMIEVTDFIKPNVRNLISVRTDNYIKEGWWYEGGGIYAPVSLIYTEQTHFADNGVYIYTEKGEGNCWTLNVKAEVEGDKEELSYEVVFDGKTYKETSIAVTNPGLWSPDEPNLYPVTVKLCKGCEQIDEYTAEIGFRTVTFSPDNGCILNGEPMKLKGVCLHHDHAGVGVAVSYEVHLYRLKKLKDMGCNYIRTAHNPQNEAFYRACDRVGICVGDENRHFSSSERTLRELRTIVRRDRNHPCVILWSLCNEEYVQGQKLAENVARTMKAVVHEEDSTRFVTAAINSPLENNGVVKAVDVIGFNYFQYGYDEFHLREPNLPMIGSENVSHLSTRGVTETCRKKAYLKMNGSVPEENLQQWAAMPGHAWREVDTRPFMAGLSYWTGFDYRGEPAPFNWPAHTSSYGAMDLCGFPKANFYWNQAMWKNGPQLSLSPHWNFSEGETAEISSYSNCDTVELFVNGVSVGEKPNDKYEFINWYVPFEAGTVTAIGKNGGNEVCRAELKTAGEAKEIKLIPHKNEFDSGYGDVCVVDVCIVDENGIRLPNADNKISFGVSGGARLIGVGNGDSSSMEHDKGSSRSLFYGWCQAIIEVCEEGVPVTFSAECDGIGSAELNFENNAHSHVEYIESLPAELSVDYWWANDVTEEYPSEAFELCERKCWIPTTAGMGANPLISGKTGYVLWLNHFPYPAGFEGKVELVCPNIQGYAEIYVGENLVYDGFSKREHYDLHLPIHQLGLNGLVQIRVIFKLDGGDTGIYEDMYISVG